MYYVGLWVSCSISRLFSKKTEWPRCSRDCSSLRWTAWVQPQAQTSIHPKKDEVLYLVGEVTAELKLMLVISRTWVRKCAATLQLRQCQRKNGRSDKTFLRCKVLKRLCSGCTQWQLWRLHKVCGPFIYRTQETYQGAGCDCPFEVAPTKAASNSTSC